MVMRGVRPMRLLADYHHDCLYESHLRLFEDRLGWEVYRPTGMAWAESGLWSYSENPAIAHQFLDPWPGQVLVPATPDRPEHYAAPEVHHPDRIHKLVTLDQFYGQPWDWLLASITQHETSWHRLAESIGARSILQVGNVGQPVDWGLSHHVLAAAALPIPDGRGVIYHPEFDRHEYRYAPPANPRLVVNLMNCLPDAGPAWDDWQALRRLLPEFEFREYGILGADGIVGPSSRVGDVMREAGWAFHDKPQGDGYGFVAHQWASVGRPLVGRRSYYTGKLAEPLWTDDAIDLDAGPEAAAERMRRLAGTDEWRAMAALTSARFRAYVDWAAEAAAIADYLR